MRDNQQQLSMPESIEEKELCQTISAPLVEFNKRIRTRSKDTTGFQALREDP